MQYDVAIAGGGPGGCATALSLRAHAPSLSVAIVKVINKSSFSGRRGICATNAISSEIPRKMSASLFALVDARSFLAVNSFGPDRSSRNWLAYTGSMLSILSRRSFIRLTDDLDIR